MSRSDCTHLPRAWCRLKFSNSGSAATEKISEELRKTKSIKLGQLPLNALRAFDAAARHRSLTKAAVELNVTPGAVGHQINKLQERLDVKLFNRVGNRLELTKAGETVLPLISSAFTTLCLAMESIAPEQRKPSVKIAVDITFASMWLAPKLAAFSQQEPSIDVWVVPPVEHLSQIPGEVDLAIRYTNESSDGLLVTHLHDETILPICSPGYLASSAPLRHPSDLQDHALLAVESSPGSGAYPDWASWGASFGVDDIEDKVNVHFAHSILAIQAVLADQGVALVSLSNVERYIENGDLVLPFEHRYALEHSRYLLTPAIPVNRACTQLLEWLMGTRSS